MNHLPVDVKSPKSRLYLLFVAVPVIYVGLPMLILLNVIPFEYKFYALTAGGVLTYMLFRYSGFSNRQLGITLEGSGKSLLRVAPLTLALLVVACLLYMTGYSRMEPTEDWLFYLFYIFISCPVQEFLYRGALTVFGEAVRLPGWGVLLLTSALYGFVHIIYLDPLTVAATFLIGLYWFWAYNKARSLVGVSVSHAVLGVVTIAAGLID